MAVAKAEENAQDFLVGLVRRVERLEARASGTGDPVAVVERALRDPDVAAVLQQAVLGAARTNSRRRHEILARAVAERLTADAGSVRAVASNLAVEAVHKLATPHLDVLGLLAVVHVIRPTDIAADGAFSDEALGRYLEWLRVQLAHYEAIGQVSVDTYAHLAATACIAFELRVKRRFTSALAPHEPAKGRRAFGWTSDAFSGRLFLITGNSHDESSLQHLWDAGLQHALPTPAGRLIGCAVHDEKLGTESAVNWEWDADRHIGDDVVDRDVWDGRHIDREFVQRLLEELDANGVDRWTRRRNPRGG